MKTLFIVFIVILFSSAVLTIEEDCKRFCNSIMRDCVNVDVDSGMSDPDNPKVDLEHLRKIDEIHRNQLKCFKIKIDCINKCKSREF